MMKKTKWIFFLIFLAISLNISACVGPQETDGNQIEASAQTVTTENEVAEDGAYSSPEDVAAYLQSYHRLPSNYITKQEARDLGWISEDGNLWEVTNKMSIGGDRFGNREGLLPKADGRQWYECDVNYEGGYRGSERLVYSNDGLIFYTQDHYKSFEEIGGADNEND